MNSMDFSNANDMIDSGIDLDLMSYLGAEDDPVQEKTYYELKSSVVVGSPVTEIKHASLPMRANLKQQLQRQQLLEQEKRDHDVGIKLIQGHMTGSNGIAVPRSVESAEVPTNVLQVKTQLVHPTKYHVRQSQKRQVAHFLNESAGLPAQSLPAHVVPAAHDPLQQQQQYHIQSSSSAPDPDLPSPLMGVGSDFISSNEFDLLGDFQGLDQTLDLSSMLSGGDLVEIEPSFNASSTSSFVSALEGEGGPQHTAASCPTPEFSHSDLQGNLDLQGHGLISSVNDEMWRKERIKKDMMCVIDGDNDMWRKERIKKDNHNIIERRRRFNINDRIKELGGLLPRTFDPESRQNKGNILKASVDYIKSLQDDQRRLQEVSEQKRKMESDLRRMLITVNQMASVMQSHGLQSPLLETTELQTVHLTPNTNLDFLNPAALSNANSPSHLSSATMSPLAPSPSAVSPSPLPLHGGDLHHSPLHELDNVDHSPLDQGLVNAANGANFLNVHDVEDFMMDTTVNGDPMLMSAPVSPEEEFAQFNN